MSSTAVHDATIYCHDGPTLGAAAGGRFALPVSVAWRADDQELFSPPYAPVAALGSNGYNVSFLDTPEPSSRPAGDTSSASPRSSGGFSTGAIAGTAAGVAVVVLAALAVLWWYIRRRRRRSRQPSASTRDGVGETAGVDVLPLRTEKDGDERFEIGDTAKPNEAGGTSIAELDGGWQAAEVDAKGPRAGA